jgi:hypothetical protein
VTELYSYVVVHDHGVAPDPSGGLCSLVICKPKSRLRASEGDWVAGCGARTNDLGGRLIYAMRVTEKITMAEYFERFGGQRRDAIYDFSQDPPLQHKTGPHGENEYKTDLGGKYALLSEHFYYFASDNALELPEHLSAISNIQRNHRRPKNKPFVEPFVAWIEGLGYKPNRLYGMNTQQEVVALERKKG